MFDKFEVLMSWKLSWGLSFLFLALVMDTFFSISQIIAHANQGFQSTDIRSSAPPPQI